TCRPDLDHELEATCLKALAKRGEERHASMAELAADLELYLRKKHVDDPASCGQEGESQPATTLLGGRYQGRTATVPEGAPRPGGVLRCPMDPSLQPLLARLDRLGEEFREIREGIHKAIRIASEDPEMALTRTRKVLELVIRDIYERRIKEPPATRP